MDRGAWRAIVHGVSGSDSTEATKQQQWVEVPVVILLLIVTPVFLQSDCENLQRTYKVLTTVTVFLQKGEGRKKETKNYPGVGGRYIWWDWKILSSG